MKFMIGYQLTENQDFVSEIIQNKSHIYEVYFSWGKMPNGRNSVLINKSFTQMEAQERLVDDLKILSKNGIALNLLLNGNCYGRLSLAKSFSRRWEIQLIIYKTGFLLSQLPLRLLYLLVL